MIAIVLLIVESLLVAGFIRRHLWDKTMKRVILLQKRWSIPWAIFSLLAGAWLTMNIPLAVPPVEYTSFLAKGLIRIVFLISAGTGIGSGLFIFSIWLAEIIPGKTDTIITPIPIKSILKFALPIALVWCIYLLAFYPGMMSADSMVQWEQVLSGQYNDHHPVFHTLLIWLVTRIYLSPVSVAVAQIVAMSLVAGAWLGFFEQLKIRSWLIWLTAIVFAAIPVNGTMVNTLWKDIPYGISVMGLTLLLARMVYSYGEWLVGWGARLILGATLAVVSLLRHDGIILGVGTIFVVLLCFPRRWKFWLTSCVVFAILYLGVRGPIYSWVGVQRSTELADSSLSLYDMAAYSMPGSEADRLFTSMQIFPPNWSCRIWTNLSPDWQATSIDTSQTYIQIAMNLFQHLPKVLTYDYRCERSMEWIIWDPDGEVRNASHTQILVDPNPYGIQAASKIPAMRDWIANWVGKTSQDTDINWFIWRPAFFLYLAAFIAAVVILRNRDVRFGLLVVPLLLQAVTFTLIIALPNFRYHYATYLVALISFPLLFSPTLLKERQTL